MTPTGAVVDPLVRAVTTAEAYAAEPPTIPTPKAGTPIRTLLVICRPKERDDVPFRSHGRASFIYLVKAFP